MDYLIPGLVASTGFRAQLQGWLAIFQNMAMFLNTCGMLCAGSLCCSELLTELWPWSGAASKVWPLYICESSVVLLSVSRADPPFGRLTKLNSWSPTPGLLLGNGGLFQLLALQLGTASLSRSA